MGRFVAASIIVAGLASFVGAFSARADDPELHFFSLGLSPTLIVLNAGAFAAIDNNQGGMKGPAGDFQIDAIPQWTLVSFGNVLEIHPYVGGFMTTKKSAMGYAGLHGTIPVGPHFEVDPFAAVGYYGKGDGRDMGSVVLFHAGLSGLYVFDDGYRAGLTFTHESNGGALPRHQDHCTCNPGANDLLLTVGVPFSALGNF